MSSEHFGARSSVCRIRPVSFAAVKKEPLTVEVRDNITLLDLGQTAIWDGADLVLLRKTLAELGRSRAHRAIGFQMRHVCYLPSGFFSTLCDWHAENGPYSVWLYEPHPQVQEMLWFKYFFADMGDDCHVLLCQWSQSPRCVGTEEADPDAEDAPPPSDADWFTRAIDPELVSLPG